ncbi:hypothetical protein [Acinetobacter ursingii]|uniref:hypothetical protein n=1 Tax=Acinetobacter ursingii TaxID=108980 RepID=UPI0030092E69
MKKFLYFFIPIMLIVLTYSIYSYNQSYGKLLNTEINKADYYQLITKLNYVNGSQQELDFKDKIKSSLDNDGIISKAEYKKITGYDARIIFNEKPENIKLYADSKSKLIKMIND